MTRLQRCCYAYAFFVVKAHRFAHHSVDIIVVFIDFQACHGLIVVPIYLIVDLKRIVLSHNGHRHCAYCHKHNASYKIFHISSAHIQVYFIYFNNLALSNTEKRLPFPNCDFTLMLPFRRSTMAWQIDSPRPVP